MRKCNWGIFIFLILIQITVAQTTVTDIINGQAIYYNHTPNIARGSDGTLVSAWQSAEDQIVYSKYDESFSTWSPAIQISNAGNDAHKAGLAADNDGNIYCIWQQRDSSAQDWGIYFKKINASEAPVNLTGNDAENEEASIICDDNGRIFVAWNTGAEADGGVFVYAIYSDDGGANWSTPAVLSSADGILGGGSGTAGRPYLTAGKNGKVVCAWHEHPDGFDKRESYTNQFDGTSWAGEVAFNYTADSANTMYPAVAVGSDDMVYMATVSYTSPERLFFLKKAWGDAEWPTEPNQIILADDQLTKPFLVMDENDNFYMTFRMDDPIDTTFSMENAGLITSSDGGNTWTDPTRLSAENHDAGYISIANNVSSSGVDILWRETSRAFADDGDSISIIHANIDLLTSVEEGSESIPNKYQLYQNYPNPFNPTTNIKYNISKAGNYQLVVYNALGEKISTLVSSHLTAGEHTSFWNGTNDAGNKMTTGIYFYQLNSEDINLTKKMILLQ
ncbi:MAG: T9SS type A sorting domain-containing protein [Ignavibacteriae bacterium]|nr:T9SS type A sorting domain-containing protein [Ignavibacteriota bacterium]